jgi:hypothetical protein
MNKTVGNKQAALKQTFKRTLAAVTKEMRQPRKTESVRQEEITHLHIRLQRRKTN